MLHVPQYNIEAPVLRVSGMGDYFPVRQFCKATGLASQPQLEKLQSDGSYADLHCTVVRIKFVKTTVAPLW